MKVYVARANTSEAGSKSTTPVDNYPGGASPFGVQDMAGNVWEWTSTTYRSYPYQANDGREDLNNHTSKVLRGGAWNLQPRYMRTTTRLSYLPSYKFDGLGARLVRGVMD